jgi:hypothetical protein
MAKCTPEIEAQPRPGQPSSSSGLSDKLETHAGEVESGRMRRLLRRGKSPHGRFSVT